MARRAVDVLPRGQLGRLVPRPLPPMQRPVAVAAGAAAAAAARDAVGVLVGDGDARPVPDVDGRAGVAHCGESVNGVRLDGVLMSAPFHQDCWENWRA